MKKKLYASITLMLVFTILLTLSACGKKANKLYDIDKKIHSSGKVQCVTDKTTYSAEDTVIHYTLTNVTDSEISIPGDSGCFELHKLVDGGWKRVGTNCDIFVNDFVRILKPGESVVREITLDKYYYLPLEKGEYSVYVSGIYSNTFEIT